MHNCRVGVVFAGVLLSSFLIFSDALANNLNISNVHLGARDLSAKTVTVIFDIAWDNSWRNKINHDAAWLTVRMADAQSASGVKRLCKLSASGISPSGFSAGTDQNAEVYVPADKTGVFIRPAAHQDAGAFSSKNVRLVADYSSGGFSESASIAVNIVGIEMVLVPEGDFYAGDFAQAQASLKQGAADNTPWLVNSRGPIPVTGTNSGGYYYTSAGHSSEFVTGSSFNVPLGFPNGFAAFYAMKYEITEGLWVEFINSLPAAERIARDLTDASHKNTDAVLYRNTIACSGAPLVCSTQRPFRAASFLTWKDLCAFLDWAALRPLTELEFEKAARGPSTPLAGELAWGTTAIASLTQLSGIVEDGQETVVTAGANANFGDQVLSGGDAASGEAFQKGPVRSGIFSTNISTRVSSGAGYFGIMELSGDLKEWAVTLGNAQGLAFTGKNGDGYLTSTAGVEGSADVENWPGMDVNATKGVVSSLGAGLRGGSWQDASARLQVSDRSEAALTDENAGPAYGGRGARTVDGQ